MNGDGLFDLLQGKKRDELEIFTGESSQDLFASESQKLAVQLPNDERNIWLADLNRDGKQDILVRHRSATEQNSLTLLVTK